MILRCAHIISVIAVLLLTITAFTTPGAEQTKKDMGLLTIRFIHKANSKPINLHDSIYTNVFNETYSITKLRYYISNIDIGQNQPLDDTNNYQLIDLANATSFTIPVKSGKYKQIGFLLGIDSLRNCSGAQEGVLDPMRDMFWTWNTGYVIFKLEGRSAASTVKQRLEHHIGGYRFGNNVSTPMALQFPDEVKIKEGKTTEVFISVDLDKYWNSTNLILIKENALCTLPGSQAKKIAANLPAMFTIDSIKEPTE